MYKYTTPKTKKKIFTYRRKCLHVNGGGIRFVYDCAQSHAVLPAALKNEGTMIMSMIKNKNLL